MAALTGPLRVAPVVIRRRCRVAAGMLDGLGGDELWSAAARLAEVIDDCERRGAALAERLGALVPAATDQRRRVLLRARRDAFNARPATGVDDVDGAAAYRYALAGRDELTAQVRRLTWQLAATTRATLLTALADQDFATSVELSVPGLVGSAPAALDSDSAKARRRTLTLFRLLQRAATKPTPFARFTDSTLLAPGVAERPPRSHLRVDRRALDWVRHWLRERGHRVLPADRSWLTTNPTATVRDGRVGWLAGAGLRTAACSAELAAVLERLRTPATLAELSQDGMSSCAMDRLVQSGLLETGLRLPGWGTGTLAAAADAVDADDDSALQVRDALRVLNELESAAGPRGITGPARTGMRRLAAACGVRDDGTDRLLVTEDVVGAGPAAGPQPNSAALADLARLQRIAPLLGPELPFQLASAVSLRERFGEQPVPLLTAFRWYLDGGRQTADDLIAASQHPVLTEVLGLRTELVRGLAKRAAEAPDAEEITCDADWLDELADALPPEVAEWPCVAWPVQQAGDRLVLNGIGLGYGRFAARIAGTLTEPELDRLRGWIAEAAGPDLPVDIAARFGATANEHPLLLPAALAYPGSALECDPATRVDLSTVTLHLAGARPVLHSSALPGRELLPVPHNATLASLAPVLFRWLSRFGPPPGSTLALWDQVDAGVAAGGVRHYPRLRLGDLVVCRRTWKVPGDVLPSAAGVLDWRRWSDRTGVPRRSFLRGTTLPDPWDVMRGLASDHRVRQARSRSGAGVRKPAYVDLSQPLCWPLDVSGPGETLTFTEPLPDPIASVDHVTEYVIETSLSPSRRRTA